MIDKIVKSTAKKIITYDLKGKENGFVTEMFKDGDKTVIYLSAASPKAFKGYHLHRIRAARYICIKGKMKIILYVNRKRQEHILNAGDRLYIPKMTPTGLQNIGDEESWLINYPDPSYDPALKDEQVDYTEAELEKGILR